MLTLCVVGYVCKITRNYKLGRARSLVVHKYKDEQRGIIRGNWECFKKLKFPFLMDPNIGS
jgi:hypothetical protein